MILNLSIISKIALVTNWLHLIFLSLVGFRIVLIEHCTSRQEKVIWELNHDQQQILPERRKKRRKRRSRPRLLVLAKRNHKKENLLGKVRRMKREIVTINGYNECVTWLVMLEIVMVIPVKYESLSRTNESHFNKQRVQSLNCLDLSCIQTVNLKADSKTLYYSILNLTYSPSLSKSHEQDNLPKHTFRSIDRSIFVGRMPWINFHSRGFFMRQERGTQRLVSLKVNLRRPLFFICFFFLLLLCPTLISTLQKQPCLRAPNFCILYFSSSINGKQWKKTLLTGSPLF